MEIGHRGSLNQSFSITADPQSVQKRPSYIAGTNGYEGPDWPSDDKPNSHSGLWQAIISVVETISWQPLFVTREVIGYALTVTLQKEGSLPGFKSCLWLPLAATVVVGWLTRSQWNPASPLFSQMDEQEASEQHELQVITLMNPGQQGSVDWPGQSPPFSSDMNPGSFVYLPSGHWSGGHGSGGGFPPDPPSHTRGENCPLFPCTVQGGYCIFAPQQHSGNCRCPDCLKQLDAYYPLPYTSDDFYVDYPVVATSNPVPETPSYSCHHCSDGSCLQCTSHSYSGEPTIGTQAHTIAEDDSTTSHLTAPAVTTNMTGENLRFSCSQCNAKYSHQHKLNDHQKRRHPTEEQLRYPCQQCDRRFVWQSVLKEHVRTAHRNHVQPTQEYRFCPRKRHESRQLKSTQLTCVQPGHKCDQCDQEFARHSLLKLHQKFVHPTDQ